MWTFILSILASLIATGIGIRHYIIVKSENKLTLNGINSTLPIVGAGLPSPYGQPRVQIIMGFTII